MKCMLINQFLFSSQWSKTQLAQLPVFSHSSRADIPL